MARTTTRAELLQAIQDGSATMGYRPVENPKERNHENWLAIGNDEISNGHDVLVQLVRDGHRITKRCQFHMSHGRGRGSASYELSIAPEGEDDGSK